MKKILLLTTLAVISAITGLWAQVISTPNGTATNPVVSTLANPVYYYIESASDGTVNTGSPAFTGDFRGMVVYPNITANTIMKFGVVPAGKDSALWAIVNDGGIVKAYNKQKGWYIVSSHTSNTTGVGIEFAPVAGTTRQYSIFSDGVSGHSRLIAWKTNLCNRWSNSQGANSLTAWYFVLPKTDVDLAIANATNVLNNFSAEGTQPGQYSAIARNTLQTAINAAITVRDNPASTQVDKDAAAAVLSEAIDTYHSSKVKLATDGSKWYFIKSQRGSTATALYAENQGVSAPQVLNKEQAYTNAQAWKIVANGTGFALVNKLDASNINSDLTGTGTTGITVNLPTIATVPTKPLNIFYSGQDAASLDYFRVENKILEPGGGTATPIIFRLHAGGAGNNWGLVNWVPGTTNIGMYDNTQFQLIEAPATADATNSPASGEISGGSTITLSDVTSGAVIYYTTDGTEPTTASTSVSSGGTIAAPVSGSLTVKTLAVAPNSFPSNVVTSSYTITATRLNLINSTYVIKAINGIVKVDGAEDFEVYSVTGQKQNKQAQLKSGIYIVKIRDYSQKVIVK